MKSSSRGVGMTPALEQIVRAVPNAGRVMIEARVETGADIRQRLDQWQQLDSTAGIDLLGDGGVTLPRSTASGPASNVVTASARSKLDAGFLGPFIDPLVLDGKNRLAALVAWAGTEPAIVELTQILANLNPQFDQSLAPTVKWWQLDLYRVTQVDFNVIGQGTFRIQPLLSKRVPAPGQAA